MPTSMELEQYGLPFWLDFERTRYPALPGDMTVDAVVIGAGVAGLKIARCLARHGVSTAILEGKRVGEGASSRNQGTINHSASLGYRACIEKHSRETACSLWQLGLENHRMLREQIDEYEIDCDYQVDGCTTLVRRDCSAWEDTLAHYGAEYELLREDGFDVTLLDENEAAAVGGSTIYAGGLRYNTDAQFHSGKYVIGLARGVSQRSGVELYERTRVESVDSDGANVRVVTDHGVIATEQVFLATNALAPQFVRHLEPALRAERGQVFVTEPLDERPCRGSFGTTMAWWREIAEPDGRFRLLFGGGRERDEPDSLFPQYQGDAPHPLLETEGFQPSIAHQQRLDTELAKLFPHLAGARITHRWGGLQSFTADDLPKIGLFDPDRSVYGIAGFCGRGNCHSDVGADYLVGLALDVQTPVREQFGGLIDSLMTVDRESADWSAWQSLHAH